MTARERAIEAGLKAAEDDPRWKFDIYPTGWAEVEDIVTIAAPFIESALLDRMLSEDAVQSAAKNHFIAESGTEGMWTRLGPRAKNTHYRLARAALTAAVAVANRACPSCGGTGVEPGSERPCGSCDGEGTVDW